MRVGVSQRGPTIRSEVHAQCAFTENALYNRINPFASTPALLFLTWSVVAIYFLAQELELLLRGLCDARLSPAVVKGIIFLHCGFLRSLHSSHQLSGASSYKLESTGLGYALGL